jgi:hypothetical protein
MSAFLRDKDIQQWAKIGSLLVLIGTLVVLILQIGVFAGAVSAQHQAIINEFQAHCPCR